MAVEVIFRRAVAGPPPGDRFRAHLLPVDDQPDQLGEGLGTIVPPQVTSVSRKPLSIALEEIAASKITYHREGLEGEEGAETTEADPEAEAPQ